MAEPLTEQECKDLELAEKFMATAKAMAMQSGRCPNATMLRQVQAARETIKRLRAKMAGDV